MGRDAGPAAFEVRKCKPPDDVAYLAPGAEAFQSCNASSLPPAPHGCLRVVCISDTHNEHAGLRLPPGDLLIHSGDCLTESGARYVVRSGKRGAIKAVKPEGESLFKGFAEWFGRQDFPHKVLVAGNHDLVLQGLGKERVQQLLSEASRRGRAVYLEHDEVCVGGVHVFGSPFGYWGGDNDAFLSRDCDYTDLPAGMDIVVTHMPAILPSEGSQLREDLNLTSALHRTGASLHVSGHCHWAHGVYHTRDAGGRAVPCVVASVCDSKWLGGPARGGHLLASADGVRGDPADRSYGGYNLTQPCVVCDLRLPGGRQAAAEDTVPRAAPAAGSLAAELPLPSAAEGRPALLFFGPPNDPDFVRALLPPLRELFDVDFVDSTADGLQAVASGRPYAACLAKLGTKGNLSFPILSALRESQGAGPFVAIHSATAAASPGMRDKLAAELAVDLFAGPGEEDALLRAVAPLAGAAD